MRRQLSNIGVLGNIKFSDRMRFGVKALHWVQGCVLVGQGVNNYRRYTTSISLKSTVWIRFDIFIFEIYKNIKSQQINYLLNLVCAKNPIPWKKNLHVKFCCGIDSILIIYFTTRTVGLIIIFHKKRKCTQTKSHWKCSDDYVRYIKVHNAPLPPPPLSQKK